MHPRSPIPDALTALASHQELAVTRRQALQLGVPPGVVARLLASGDWRTLARGVYQVDDREPAWRTLAMAAVLSGGEHAALAGRAAAHLAGLVRDAPLPIPVLVPHGRTPRGDHGQWRFIRSRTPFRAVGTPPRTTTERTVIDLCAAEPVRSVHWVTEAVGSHLTTPARLRRELARHPRCAARTALDALLDEVAAGAQSPLELVYLRDVERAHKLPAGIRQDRSGGYYRDVYYEQGLVIELDGRLGHEGIGRFRDRARDNHHTMLGHPTLRIGYDDCFNDPCGTASMVARKLAQLGWTGQPRRCRRCHGA